MIKVDKQFDGRVVRYVDGPYGRNWVEVRKAGLCTCAAHCAESPYHESACCHDVLCDCWCHLEGKMNNGFD